MTEIVEEAPLDAGRAIVDPHHHFWDILPGMHGMQAPHRCLIPETVAMIAASGHAVTHTVAVECGAMYRAVGPDEMRPVGETEFVNGMAAMAASGIYGPCRIAAGIVGSADLFLGDGVTPVLEEHVAAGRGRFRGIRLDTAYSEAGMFGWPCPERNRTALVDPRFQAGVRALAAMGLTLDVWIFHTQLPQLIALADAVPEATIILDHLGTPETLGRYAGRAAEARAEWLAGIEDLARRPNVAVKLGGLGMDPGGAIGDRRDARPSELLAAKWRSYVEPCIAAFGADRCMFESNFPPDEAAGTYGATWNAFKRIALHHSEDEKDALFSRTAARIYRLDTDGSQEQVFHAP